MIELECLRCGWRWLWEPGGSTGCPRCYAPPHATRTYEPDHDESEDE